MSAVGRVRQFIRAVGARLTAADEQYLEKYLTAAERTLFKRMSTMEQCHCLNTARTAERAGDILSERERHFLIRCAMLHDVGKQKGDISIIAKVFCVLIDAYLPKAAKKLAQAAEKRGGGVGWALFVYYRHAEIGAEKLRRAGINDIAAIIELHHQPPAEADGIVLKILKQADELN